MNPRLLLLTLVATTAPAQPTSSADLAQPLCYLADDLTSQARMNLANAGTFPACAFPVENAYFRGRADGLFQAAREARQLQMASPLQTQSLASPTKQNQNE